MDFFNIPSELSKANSPAYKSGLLKLYAKGGFTGRSDYKRSIENDIRVGMYEDGGMQSDPPKSYMLPSRPSQLAPSAREIAGRNTQESTRIVRPQFTADDLSQIQQKEEQRKNLAAVRSMQPATEALQRKLRIEDANKAQEESLTTSNNWQQLLARQSQAIGDKLDVPFIPNAIDPFYMIGSMASNLGAAPYNMQQGNYGQAAWSVAAPVLTGALAGIGAKSIGQFANNLFNPLAGLDLTYKRPPFFPVKEGIAVAKNTIENAGGKIIQDLKSPEGLKRLRAQFKQANPNFTEAQLDHLVETRLEEISDAVIFNKPSYLNESIERLEHFGGGLDDIPSEVIQSNFPVGNAHFSTSSPFAPTKRYPSSKLFPNAQMRKDAEIAFGRELPLLPEEKFTDPVFLPGSLTLGKGFETNVGVLDHEIAHAMQKAGFMPIDTELSKVLPKNTETVIDPITGEYSFIDKRNWFEKTLFPYSEETLRHKAYFDDAGLRTVSNERFPFAVEQRRSMIDKGILKDRYDKITPYKLFQARLAANKIGGNRVVQNDRVVGFTPWWKYGELAKAMNKMPAVIPPAAVLGGAAATQKYEDGGRKQPLIRPSARLNFVNPSGGVGYQADLNRGPLSVGLRGYTDVMHPLETELSPSIGLHGRMGDINASYNFAQNQANFNARLGGDKFSLMGNAHLDQGNLAHAGLNSRYQVTPDLSFQGNINWDSRAPHPLGYNLGVSYRKKFAEGGEMDEDPPKSYMLPSRPSQLAPSARQIAGRNTQESTRTATQNFTPQQRAAAIPRQSNVIGALDIASDIMRFGKYIPHPVAQAIGNAGTLLGNGIDMYQGINYLNQRNYKDAAANAIMSRVGKTSGLGAGFELAHDISNYEKGGLQLFGKGGYRVVRTSERKGKTHKVIGPGGKVKYFGDPSMGERSKSKYGKEAFYKRHAKNLKANPYFRAYARATWSEGGIVRDVEPFNLSSY